jgi:hypothetical protein
MCNLCCVFVLVITCPIITLKCFSFRPLSTDKGLLLFLDAFNFVQYARILVFPVCYLRFLYDESSVDTTSSQNLPDRRLCSVGMHRSTICVSVFVKLQSHWTCDEDKRVCLMRRSISLTSKLVDKHRIICAHATLIFAVNLSYLSITFTTVVCPVSEILM